ncbi:hypothetical protein VF_A0633 [Aliivibrio fischeri ES114]|uniref:Uncharacterized protein n=1 Tax=Aliivibrio fischeri (strain ATCC 700601 / ES114) TaxID=312309 RepID=Q5DZU3_ALIF1|nr:hypothetical protein [Aliivibrio fischeri]AAW87703.1 hypothetical protein VF_A0633 [Aliivibrio fischeri ES114]KLU78146.1 hypothetical protein AB192_13295 [Aliivibrio fischeri]
MTSCSMDLNSFKYDIDENLKLLNLPTTETVVGAGALSWVMIDRIDKAITLASNPKLPLSVVARAGAAGAGVYAAFWAGAVIGSSARSFYRNTSCSLSQVIDFGRDNGITGSWLETILSQNPELLHA